MAPPAARLRYNANKQDNGQTAKKPPKRLNTQVQNKKEKKLARYVHCHGYAGSKNVI